MGLKWIRSWTTLWTSCSRGTTARCRWQSRARASSQGRSTRCWSRGATRLPLAPHEAPGAPKRHADARAVRTLTKGKRKQPVIALPGPQLCACCIRMTRATMRRPRLYSVPPCIPALSGAPPRTRTRGSWPFIDRAGAPPFGRRKLVGTSPDGASRPEGASRAWAGLPIVKCEVQAGSPPSTSELW